MSFVPFLPLIDNIALLVKLIFIREQKVFSCWGDSQQDVPGGIDDMVQVNYSPVIKEWNPYLVIKFGTPNTIANFSKTVEFFKMLNTKFLGFLSSLHSSNNR